MCTVGLVPASAQQAIGGDQGWYAVHCNVDGAQVFFDEDYKGVIQSGVLTVPVYTTGTPYKEYTVQKEGYTTYTNSITGVPQKGQTIDLYATLNLAQPTGGPIGGDQGWYAVHCNVNGATVMFDNDVKGVIANGVLTVPVYVTGTPYRTYSVTMTGYTPFTAAITQYPAKGETVDLYSTLNPATTTAPTQGPLGIATVAGALGAAVIGLGLLSKKD